MYREDDQTTPINYYGEINLAGERFVREIRPDSVITSTSVHYGQNPVRQNFVTWAVDEISRAKGHKYVPLVIECAKTIKHHWNGIDKYIKIKIDNEILEGTNSLIQTAKDSARGFRSTENFIRVYLEQNVSIFQSQRINAPLRYLAKYNQHQ